MANTLMGSALRLDFGNPGPSHQVNVAKVVFSGIICTVGLIGNLLVIFVILVLREYKKSVTHWYVLQLALADSFFLFTLPFKMVEDVQGEWVYAEWMCKGKETLLFLNYYASILFLMIMSIDRYIAVCHTFNESLQKLRKPAVSLLITAVTWLIALLMCIPVMLYSFKVGQKGSCICSYRFPMNSAEKTEMCLNQGYTTATLSECFAKNENTGTEPYCVDTSKLLQQYNNSFVEFDDSAGSGSAPINHTSSVHVYFTTTTQLSMLATIGILSDTNGDDLMAPECHYLDRPQGWKIFNVFNFVVMFLIPFLVMVACYGLIIHRLSTTRMRTASTHSNPPPGSSCRGTKHSSRSDRDRRRVTIMCASLVTCFVLCWLPFHAVHMAKIHGIESSQSNLCETLSVVGSLLAYLNSALNPYLYSFLGTSFARRWTTATTKVKKSAKAKTTSLSGHGPSVRFTKKQSNGKEISSVASTGFTKIYKSERDSSTKQTDGDISMAEIPKVNPLDIMLKEHPEQSENGESQGLVSFEEK